jgi:hypothetical protein
MKAHAFIVISHTIPMHSSALGAEAWSGSRSCSRRRRIG